MRIAVNIDRRRIADLDRLSQWTPTPPDPLLLQRTPPDEDIGRMLTACARGIEETVNFGTHVLDWTGNVQRGGHELAPIFFSLRHILELLDSVSVLVANSCVDACALPLRGVLEAALGTKYMLDDASRRRAMGYMVWRAHHRIRGYEALDPATEAGRQTIRDLESDGVGTNTRLEHGADARAAIENLRQLLALPQYVPVDAEYRRTRQMMRNPPWYALYDGPRNLRKLAEHVGHPALYQFFYRHWSGRVHGTSVIEGRLTPGSDGTGAMIQTRFPGEAEQVTLMTMNLAMMVFLAFIDTLAPDRRNEYREWYLRIRPFFQSLQQGPFLWVSVHETPAAGNP